MDQRPQLFRQELSRRPRLGELLPLLLTLAGAVALLALIVAIIVWANSVTIPQLF
jgi:hypothetical protein